MRLLKAVLEQLVSTQTQGNVKLWEEVTQSLEPRGATGLGAGESGLAPSQPATPKIKVQKMIPVDDSEAYLSVFE